MNPIRNAVNDYIEERHIEGNRKRGDELSQLEPRIPVSQIGHCPRMAILDAVRWHPDHPLHAEPTHGFDPYVKEIMEAGNVWEHQTGKALARNFDGTVHWERDDPALRVRNGVWSGHIDFLIDECDHYPAGAIIEHKATNPVNFQRKDRLPYPFHCMQVLMYRRLLQQKLQSDYVIPTYLYYRSWSNWAELQVWGYDDGIEWEGEINGKHRSGEFDIRMGDKIEELQGCWQRQELPPRYDTPTEVKFSCARTDKKGEAHAAALAWGLKPAPGHEPPVGWGLPTGSEGGWWQGVVHRPRPEGPGQNASHEVRPPGRAGRDRGDDDSHAGRGGLLPADGCPLLAAARADGGTVPRTFAADIGQEPLGIDDRGLFVCPPVDRSAYKQREKHGCLHSSGKAV